MITNNSKAADLIYQNRELILVFERIGIPLGFGEKTVEDISREHNININLLLNLLNLQDNTGYKPEMKLNETDIPVIVMYLKKSHDYFQAEVYPKIRENIKLLAECNTRKEVKMLWMFFENYCNEVSEHFAYENNTVFPYVMEFYYSLIALSKGETTIRPKANYCVNDYKGHHDDIEAKLFDLKSLLVKFLPPDDSLQLRRKILYYLFDLEKDLNTHSRIENELLIPTVAYFEKKSKQ